MPYPVSIDNFTDTTTAEVLGTASGGIGISAFLNNHNTAIEALEAKLGVDSSAVTTSHDYKFGEVTGTDKAVGKTAVQTLTNKTLTTPTITAGVAATSFDLNGTPLILDADANTSITADTNDQIDVEINGADDFRFVANVFRALSGSTLETNTINETTATSGVTIDGLLIKDNKLATNDSVVTANITNDAVTPAKLGLGFAFGEVTTEATTTSTAYTSTLSTGAAGPSVSYVAATAGTIIIFYSAELTNDTAGQYAFAAPAISGATTIAASDSDAISVRVTGVNAPRIRMSGYTRAAVNVGTNTITLQYRVDANTGTFRNRTVMIIPIE